MRTLLTAILFVTALFSVDASAQRRDCEYPRYDRYICIDEGGGYYQLFNATRNLKLGRATPGLNNCQALIPAPGDDFGCVDAGGGFYQLIDLHTGQTLGRATPGLANCRKLIP